MTRLWACGQFADFDESDGFGPAAFLSGSLVPSVSSLACCQAYNSVIRMGMASREATTVNEVWTAA